MEETQGEEGDPSMAFGGPSLDVDKVHVVAPGVLSKCKYDFSLLKGSG